MRLLLQNIKHSKMAENVEQSTKNRKYLPSIEKLDEVETCYPPIIQSRDFNLRHSVARYCICTNFLVRK